MKTHGHLSLCRDVNDEQASPMQVRVRQTEEPSLLHDVKRGQVSREARLFETSTTSLDESERPAPKELEDVGHYARGSG